MEKKVKEVKQNLNKNKKILTYALALTLGLTSLSFTSQTVNAENVKESFQEEYFIDENLNILNSLYETEKAYLENTLNKLKIFYAEKDGKNIIKNAYPNAYKVLTSDIPNPYDFDSYIKALKEMNSIILTLKIKPVGNGRDSDYGIISDENELLGFRSKTEEDKTLINEYTNILQNPIIVDDNLINLLSKDIDDVTEEELLSTLESLISNQLNYLRKASTNLQDFYTNIDNKDIIKTAYVEAYNAYNHDYWTELCGFNGTNYFVVRDTSKSNEELIQTYINTLKNNNSLICSLKIKPVGNSRDPEYGIIKDENKPLGFRTKTEEDKLLIDEYTNRLGNLVTYSPSLINYLEKINANIFKGYSKKYEN